jgi:hypothetical protein
MRVYEIPVVIVVSADDDKAAHAAALEWIEANENGIENMRCGKLVAVEMELLPAVKDLGPAEDDADEPSYHEVDAPDYGPPGSGAVIVEY